MLTESWVEGKSVEEKDAQPTERSAALWGLSSKIDSRIWVNFTRNGLRLGSRHQRRAFRPPLPTILLANLQSLDNKLCELRARISYQRETRDCCVICLTETWMSAMVPDSAITGFSVHRSDRTKELTGKSRGGGVCFYINNSWCDEGTYTLLNPSAPLIWNFICFCVNNSGYRGNLQRS